MKAGLSKEAKKRLGLRVDRVAASWEGRFSEEAKKQLGLDRDRLLEILRETPPLKQVQVDWQTVGKNWEWYYQEAGERWREAFVPLLQGTITAQAEGWEPIFANLVLGFQFNVENIWATHAYDDYLITFAQPILETTNLDTVAVLKTAMQEGWPIPKMEKAIKVLFKRYLDEGVELTDEQRKWFQDRLPRYRLENISRTETIRASNFGTLQIFEGYGAPMKEWLATLDDRVRPDHADAMMRYSEGGNPGPIPTNEPFIVGGVPMMYPGDGPPEQACNCRCTIVPYNQMWTTL